VRLLIFHYHDRPGGVREVISRGLPLLLERLDAVREVIFLAGEFGDAGWRAGLEQRLGKIPLRWVVDPEWGYGSGEFRSLSRASSRKLGELLSSPPAGAGESEAGRTVLWAHNLSVGRNIPLLRVLPDLCLAAGAELWLHHHDWWWDGRWARWRDWQSAGVNSLDEALAATVPVGPHIQHRCVNLADLPFLQNAAGPAAARWVGNPLPVFQKPTAAEVRAARQWLEARTGGRPVWLAPVRALRRKNLAESLLLTHCLAPGACLVTTGGALSPDEAPAWRKLREAADRQGLPLVPQVLAGAGPGAAGPGIPALMAASEAVVLSSLQEGFGLPWLEAAALGKPVISRWLPELEANLRAFGCHAAGFYKTLPVPDHFYDRAGEERRIASRGKALLSLLPEELGREVFGILRRSQPREEAPGVRDFACLTLEAQLEVLAGALMEFPSLECREPQAARRPDGDRAERWAERFFSGDRNPLLNSPSPPMSPRDLKAELRQRLAWWLEHPLLWPVSGEG